MSRWSLTLLLLTPAFSFGQTNPEPLKGPDREAYRDMKFLKNDVVVPGDEKQTAANRALLARQAKYMVSQLTDQKRIQMDDLNRVIEVAIVEDLPIPRGTPVKDMEKYLAFGREMGAALVTELEPALKHSKPVVRVNAARLLSVVGDLGCDKAAELALKVLAKPDESEGVKHWALRTLGNLFAIEADSVNKEVTVFTAKNRDLENRAIVALCEYITTPRDVANMEPAEIAAITFIRREAIKALGNVRTPRLNFQGKVLARPALVLLKVANKDGIVPEPDLRERVEAIVGFCQLFPVVRRSAVREVNCDYAADLLAAAIQDLGEIKNNSPEHKMTIPWLYESARINIALDQWVKNIQAMQLNATVAPAAAMQKQIKADILDAMKVDDANNRPNLAGFRQWRQNNQPKSKSFFSDEPNATMKAIGG